MNNNNTIKMTNLSEGRGLKLPVALLLYLDILSRDIAIGILDNFPSRFSLLDYLHGVISSAIYLYLYREGQEKLLSNDTVISVLASVECSSEADPRGSSKTSTCVNTPTYKKLIENLKRVRNKPDPPHKKGLSNAKMISGKNKDCTARVMKFIDPIINSMKTKTFILDPIEKAISIKTEQALVSFLVALKIPSLKNLLISTIKNVLAKQLANIKCDDKEEWKSYKNTYGKNRSEEALELITRSFDLPVLLYSLMFPGSIMIKGGLPYGNVNPFTNVKQRPGLLTRAIASRIPPLRIKFVRLKSGNNVNDMLRQRSVNVNLKTRKNNNVMGNINNSNNKSTLNYGSLPSSISSASSSSASSTTINNSKPLKSNNTLKISFNVSVVMEYIRLFRKADLDISSVTTKELGFITRFKPNDKEIEILQAHKISEDMFSRMHRRAERIRQARINAGNRSNQNPAPTNARNKS